MDDALRFVMSDWWHLTLSIATLAASYSIIGGAIYGALSWDMKKKFPPGACVLNHRHKERADLELFANFCSIAWPVALAIAAVVGPLWGLWALAHLTARGVGRGLDRLHDWHKRPKIPTATIRE